VRPWVSLPLITKPWETFFLELKIVERQKFIYSGQQTPMEEPPPAAAAGDADGSWGDSPKTS